MTSFSSLISWTLFYFGLSIDWCKEIKEILHPERLTVQVFHRKIHCKILYQKDLLYAYNIMRPPPLPPPFNIVHVVLPWWWWWWWTLDIGTTFSCQSSVCQCLMTTACSSMRMQNISHTQDKHYSWRTSKGLWEWKKHVKTPESKHCKHLMYPTQSQLTMFHP